MKTIELSPGLAHSPCNIASMITAKRSSFMPPSSCPTTHICCSPLFATATAGTFVLPEILRAIKGASARSINLLNESCGPVWQDESFDHVLRGDESLQETIEYIRQNPVRRGLVEKPEDYRWLWIACGAGTPAREV